MTTKEVSTWNVKLSREERRHSALCVHLVKESVKEFRRKLKSLCVVEHCSNPGNKQWDCKFSLSAFVKEKGEIQNISGVSVEWCE